MKNIMVSAIVKEGTEEDLVKKIRALIAEKEGTVDIQVIDAPPKGAGATLAGVA